MAEVFIESVVIGKPVYNKNECTVKFINGQTSFIVIIGIYKGELRQIQVEEKENSFIKSN